MLIPATITAEQVRRIAQTLRPNLIGRRSCAGRGVAGPTPADALEGVEPVTGPAAARSTLAVYFRTEQDRPAPPGDDDESECLCPACGSVGCWLDCL